MIKTLKHTPPLIALAAVSFAALSPAAAHEPPAPFPASEITWASGPPALPAGAEIAVLAGDPGKAAPFVFRLKFPAGYQIPAHIHAADENVTVISGTINIGHGEELDRAGTRSLTTGGFVEIPAGHPHFLWTEDSAVVQVHGMGPFDIRYINVENDPRS